MQQDRDTLPEGTDKIVAGASGPSGGAVPGTGAGASGAGTSGGGGEDAAEGTTLVADAPRSDAGRPSGGTAGAGGAGGGTGGGSTTGARILQSIRSGGSNLSGQASDRARDWVSQGLERSGEALANVSRMIGDTAPGIEERLGHEYGEYARRAAAAIESTASSLAAKDPDELIEDTRTFVRKSPGVALAGAAIVGFALARLVKTGLDATTGSGGASGGSAEAQGGDQGGGSSGNA